MKANLTSISIAVATASVLGLSALALAQQRTIKVESDGGKRNYVRVTHVGPVRLVRRLSDAACIEGRTWGSDSNGIWVSKGCRAEFSYNVGRSLRDGRRDHRNGRDWDDRDWNDRRNDRKLVVKQIKVESDGGKRTSVKISNVGAVRLARTLSDNPCREGYSWGYTSNRIWVDHGCRGVFEYMKRR